MCVVFICTVVRQSALFGALIASSVGSWAAKPSAEVEACLQAAAAKHGLSYVLLRSIAEQESNFNPIAVGGNTNGSQDFGLMQINSTWLPMLSKHGVTKQGLFNPCTNADVGAWILADNFKRLGVTWDAVGAYNAMTPWKRVKYATGVYNKLVRHTSNPSAAGTQANQGSQRPVATNSQVYAASESQANEAAAAPQNRQMASYEVQE
jgi:soluble lytic murein transglycosylase-like protein